MRQCMGNHYTTHVVLSHFTLVLRLKAPDTQPRWLWQKLVGGTRGARGALHDGRSRVRFPMASLEYLTKYFRPHYGPGVDSAFNRNEYREIFLVLIFWGIDGRCVGLTPLPPLCADCLPILGVSTSWSTKGLSRPVQRLLYPFLRRRKNLGSLQLLTVEVVTPYLQKSVKQD
jgi:hypothetical protein